MAAIELVLLGNKAGGQYWSEASKTQEPKIFRLDSPVNQINLGDILHRRTNRVVRQDQRPE